LHVPKEQIPLEELTVKEDVTYEEFSKKILETAERVTWSQVIKMCMVQWNRDTEDEATWKRKEDLRKRYHNILSKHRLNLEDEIHFKGDRIVTP
jgi:hypothetical protein